MIRVHEEGDWDAKTEVLVDRDRQRIKAEECKRFEPQTLPARSFRTSLFGEF